MKRVFLALMLIFTIACGAAYAGDIELAKKSTINSILQNGEIRAGLDPGYMPFEMTDKSGNYIGFDLDLGRELAKAMGVKFVPVAVDFDGVIPALLTGKIDIILSGMTITQERNLKIMFTDNYITIGQTILLNKRLKDKVTSWEQLNDPQYNIVCRQGTTSEEAVKRYMPRSKWKTFEKEADGAMEVLNDRADAWVYDMPFNVVFMAEHGEGKLIHLDKPFTFEPLGIGINPGDPDFLNFLNNFLKQLRADGRYDRMYNKWIKSSEWFNQTQK